MCKIVLFITFLLYLVCSILGTMGKNSQNRNIFLINGHEIDGLVFNPLVNQKVLLQMLQMLLIGKLEYSIVHQGTKVRLFSWNTLCLIRGYIIDSQAAPYY